MCTLEESRPLSLIKMSVGSPYGRSLLWRSAGLKNGLRIVGASRIPSATQHPASQPSLCITCWTITQVSFKEAQELLSRIMIASKAEGYKSKFHFKYSSRPSGQRPMLTFFT